LLLIGAESSVFQFFNPSETSSLTLTERQRLKVYENRVLRGTIGPEGQEVVWEWRRIHSKELYDFYFPPQNFRVKKSGRMKVAGHVASMREGRGA
jgi:hypothetical protein